MLFREWLLNGTNICKIIYFLNANHNLCKFFFTAQLLCKTLPFYCAIPWHCKASTELHLTPSPFQNLLFACGSCCFTCATENSLRDLLLISTLLLSYTINKMHFRSELYRKRLVVLIPCLVWKGLLTDYTEGAQHHPAGFFLSLCANTKVRWG